MTQAVAERPVPLALSVSIFLAGELIVAAWAFVGWRMMLAVVGFLLVLGVLAGWMMHLRRIRREFQIASARIWFECEEDEDGN